MSCNPLTVIADKQTDIAGYYDKRELWGLSSKLSLIIIPDNLTTGIFTIDDLGFYDWWGGETYVTAKATFQNDSSVEKRIYVYAEYIPPR